VLLKNIILLFRLNIVYNCIDNFENLTSYLCVLIISIYNSSQSIGLIKDEKWYADEVSDTTMLPIAASLFGQKK
jgi:hypothetical protein